VRGQDAVPQYLRRNLVKKTIFQNLCHREAEMILYHGTKKKGLSEILPIRELSEELQLSVGSSDPDREFFRDVVFLTTSLSLAKQYASKEGVVYTVEAEDATLYAETFKNRVAEGTVTRRKKGFLSKKIQKLERNREVFVASRAIVTGIISPESPQWDE